MPLRWPIQPLAEFIDETSLFSDGIYFALFNCETDERVLCLVTRQALLDLAASADRHGEPARETFDRCRDQIVEIASEEYDLKGEPVVVRNSYL